MRIDRRDVLKGAACAAAAASLGVPALAQGAKVFLDYTQDELDRAYDQTVWAPNQDELIQLYATRSEATRQRLKFKPAVAYGPSEDEVLDIFPCDKEAAPIHVFVHGGAWRGGSKDLYSFPADTFVPAGATYVALNFANIPKVRLPEMADQIRRAIAWLYANAATFGGDRERIFISGHSSGGHLAAVRRRPRAHLYLRPLIGRPSRRRAADHRLGSAQAAARHHQGRRLRQRHLRHAPSHAELPPQLRNLVA
jgi:arylformamidase